MKKMKQTFANLVNDESGQDLVEYALVVALVSVVSIGALQNLATAIANIFIKIEAAFTTAGF